MSTMIRLTKQADYGIILMTHLAIQHNRISAATELAADTHIPLPTTSKVLKLLSRDGILVSHRGVKGGYSLARDPHLITVAEMITALDGPIAFTECIEDTPGVCSQESVCRLRSNWQRINQAVRLALDSISLAELSDPLDIPLVQLGTAAETLVDRSPSH